MDISVRLGLRIALIVIKRLPWWLFVGLIVALFPVTWRAVQGDQEARAERAAILAAPPLARVDLAFDSRQRIGADGSEVAFRAQVIDELSGRIEQAIGSVDLSKTAIFLAAPDASDPQGDVVAAIVVSDGERAGLDAWLKRQTRGEGLLGAIIEVDGLRDDSSTGVALTKLVNLLYPTAVENARTKETVVIDGRKVEVTDFDSARYEAEVAPLTSRFIGIEPFFEGRAAALAPTLLPEKGPLLGYGILMLVLALVALDRWRSRNRPLSQIKMVAYLDDRMRKWITIFSAIWLFVAIGSAYGIGRLGDNVFRIAILAGAGVYIWWQIDKNPRYAEIRALFVKDKPVPQPRQMREPRAAGGDVRPVPPPAQTVAKQPDAPFADSPIKTKKGWFS